MPWKCWMTDPDNDEIWSEEDVNYYLKLFLNWFPNGLIQSTQLIPVTWNDEGYGYPERYQLVVFYIEVE